MSWGRYEHPDVVLYLLVLASAASLLAALLLADSLLGTLVFLALPIFTVYTLWKGLPL